MASQEMHFTLAMPLDADQIAIAHLMNRASTKNVSIHVKISDVLKTLIAELKIINQGKRNIILKLSHISIKL